MGPKILPGHRRAARGHSWSQEKEPGPPWPSEANKASDHRGEARGLGPQRSCARWACTRADRPTDDMKMTPSATSPTLGRYFPQSLGHFSMSLSNSRPEVSPEPIIHNPLKPKTHEALAEGAGGRRAGPGRASGSMSPGPAGVKRRTWTGSRTEKGRPTTPRPAPRHARPRARGWARGDPSPHRRVSWYKPSEPTQ